MVTLHGPNEFEDVVLWCPRCPACQERKPGKFDCGWPSKADSELIVTAVNCMDEVRALVEAVESSREDYTALRLSLRGDAVGENIARQHHVHLGKRLAALKEKMPS